MSNTRFAAAVSAAGLALVMAAPALAAPVTASTTNDVYCVSANQVQQLPTVPASNRFQLLAGLGSPTNNSSNSSSGIGNGNIGFSGGANYDIIAPGGRSFGLDASYQYSNFTYNNLNPNNTSGSLTLDTNDFMLDGRVKIGCSSNAWWYVGAGAGSSTQSFVDPLGNTVRKTGFGGRAFIGGEDSNGAGVVLRYVWRTKFPDLPTMNNGFVPAPKTNSWELLLTIRPGEVWQQHP
jgi:hypothetical protein